MSLFTIDYNKPGPGVNRDTPRKTGFARILEVLARDWFSFWKAGLLLLLSAVPAILGIGIAIATDSILLLLASAALGGLLAGPQLCGLTDTILRSLRDEAGFWWHTYLQAWKRNARASLLPGMGTGLLLGMQAFVLCHLGQLTVTPSFMILLVLSSLLMIGLALLLWAQLALFELPIGQLLRNTLLLFLLSPARTLSAVATQGIYWGLLWLFAPVSLSFLVLTGAWFPLLISLFLLYQPMEKAFDLEHSIQKVQEEKYTSSY